MSSQVPEVEYHCRWTPSTCMDDLCRNSSVGICGNVDDPDDDDEVGWGSGWDEDLSGSDDSKGVDRG
jgi:hypothetical protein